MTIGTFSRAALLSVRALRLYHENGILVPASVDASTGYRAYHPGQLADAAVLKRLRELSLPLAAVKEVLVARDPEVTRKVLAEHEAEMRRQLFETEHIVAELQRAVQFPWEESPIHVETTQHHHALAISSDVLESSFAAFLGSAFPRLFDTAQRGDFVVSGSPGALYAPLIPDDGPEPVTAYIPIAGPSGLPEAASEVELIEIPAATFAVTTHRGRYETIGDSYAPLGAWVAYNAEAADDPVRELYLVSAGDTEDPAEYRTQICWPIRAGGNLTKQETT